MKLKSVLTRFLAAAAVLLAAGAAHAELYNFKLTGDYTASWQLNSTVAPDGSEVGFGFAILDVEGNFPGSVLDMTDLTFYHSSVGGGMAIDDYYGDTTLLLADGSQLYTGAEATPTFKLGTFALTEFGGSGVYSLEVSVANPVPEPASMALLLGGLGVVGVMVQRRRKAS